MTRVQAYHCEGDFGAQPVHCHEEVEFVEVYQGRGTFRCGRTRHETGPGLLSVACPQEPHAGTPLAHDFAVRVLNVPLDWFEEAGLDWRPLWHRAAVREGAAALPLFARAYDSVSVLDREQALLALCRAVSGQRSGPVAPEPGRVDQAVMLLRERFTEDVSLTELAAAAGLTPSYFFRAFKETVGLSPHAYQNSLRVARAKTLLERGAAAGEVAVEVGFYDQSHLILHFKRLLGVTPARVTQKPVSSYIRPAGVG